MTSRFPESWDVVPLEDAIDKLIDYRGKTPKKIDKGIPLVTAKIVKKGEVLPPTEFIAPEDYDSWMTRGFPEVGDVVLTVEAPLGEVAQLKNAHIALAQRIVTLRGKKEYLDNTYLKYALMSPFGQSELKSRESGSTVKGIKQSELKKILLPIPPFQEQLDMAEILHNIDEKIRNNTTMNATLEKIAQRIFKSWFVDFDPVKANVEGVAFDGLSPEIQALFPNEFEESELGVIPKGWDVKKSNQLFDVAIGKTPPRKEPQWFSKSQKDITWVSIKDMGTDGVYNLSSSEYLTPEAVDKFNVKLIPENTVILSFKLTVGRLAITIEESTTNEAIAHFKHSDKSYLSSEFLYSYLKVFNFDQLGSTSSIATAVNSKIIKDLNIIEPSKEVSKAYDLIINPLFMKIKNNQQMTDSLLKIRDKLLPRLISGKITIQKAEELLEAAS